MRVDTAQWRTLSHVTVQLFIELAKKTYHGNHQSRDNLTAE